MQGNIDEARNISNYIKKISNYWKINKKKKVTKNAKYSILLFKI